MQKRRIIRPNLNARQRIELLRPVVQSFPALGIHRSADLEKLLQAELGSAHALDQWIPYGSASQRTRARSVASIYLVCAHNLPVSAWQVIVRALILGSALHLKTSSTQNREVRRLVDALPKPLDQLISVSSVDSPMLRQNSEAVIVFGSDETIAHFHRESLPSQIFLGYGHRVSLIWLGAEDRISDQLLNRIAQDVSAYDQLGCLSPQAIYLESPQPPVARKFKGADSGTRRANQSRLRSFCQSLGEALDRIPGDEAKPSERWMRAAQIREARASTLSEKVWIPTDGGTRWTIFQHQDPTFQSSDGYRAVHVHELATAGLANALAGVRGKISTVAHGRPLSPEVEASFLNLGVTRFCPIGQCQQPSPFWHHDGRPQLADLVHWVDRETRRAG